jgi:hypothetical protein
MMQRTQTLSFQFLFSLLILPLSACGPQPPEKQPAAEFAAIGGDTTVTGASSAEQTALPTPTLPQTEAEIPDIDIPDPDPGMANVVGRILWNDTPVDGLGLLLCEEIDMVDGCLGAGFDTRTDENGVYRFANVAPGEYDLVVESLDLMHWLYVTAGLKSGAGKYLVAADTTLRIPDQAIYNFDLVTISPGENELVSNARPTLEWEAYPEAAYYLVFLNQENGPAILAGQKTVIPSIDPATDLVTCAYAWQVEAYNTSGTKIAEHDGYSRFQIVDQPLRC